MKFRAGLQASKNWWKYPWLSAIALNFQDDEVDRLALHAFSHIRKKTVSTLRAPEGYCAFAHMSQDSQIPLLRRQELHRQTLGDGLQSFLHASASIHQAIATEHFNSQTYSKLPTESPFNPQKKPKDHPLTLHPLSLPYPKKHSLLVNYPNIVMLNHPVVLHF